jgi:tripartite-type tricarboxylate transporter receptor subunit TctC
MLMRMYKNPGFDVLKDFVHITRMGTSDVLLVVHSESKVNSVSELVALARSNRGKLSYGSGGVGTPTHMVAELLLSSTGVEAVHVPYKGGVQAMTALLGKEIDFTLPVLSVAFSHVESGRLRALAVAGASRNPKLAQVPTFAEAGVLGVVLTGFGGVSVPAGTPPFIVARIHSAVHTAIGRPAVRAKIEAEGGMAAVNTPAQYTQNFRDEIVLTERMMKAAKLEPQ